MDTEIKNLSRGLSKIMIAFDDFLPPQGIDFLCRFIEQCTNHDIEYFYVSHIKRGEHLHVRLRPYQDCWNVNVSLLKPTHWLPLPLFDDVSNDGFFDEVKNVH